MRFRDRTDAGQELARELAVYADRDDVLVLGLPRGGAPVAHEVASRLRVPLDVFVVRKLGVPGHEELAFGAIASGGVRVLNDDVVFGAGLSDREVEDVTQRELETLEERERSYRGSRTLAELRGSIAILVDDGLATGATMRVAVAAVRERGAARIVVAVPVAPVQTCEALSTEVEEVACLYTPQPFMAVGLWYRDFSPVSDERVRDLLSG